MLEAVQSYEYFRDLTDTVLDFSLDEAPHFLAYFPYNHSPDTEDDIDSARLAAQYHTAVAGAHTSFLGLVTGLEGSLPMDSIVHVEKGDSNPSGRGRAIAQRGAHVLVEKMLVSGEIATPHGYAYIAYPKTILNGSTHPYADRASVDKPMASVI